MTGFLESEVLGQHGVYEFVRELHEIQELRFEKLEDTLEKCGVIAPKETFNQLTKVSIIFQAGNSIYLTSKGRQLWWLLRAINGGDLRETMRQLSLIDPTLMPYEIVKEGMTLEFIHNLLAYPNFRRVFICSPWIHLKPKALRKFSYALYLAQGKSPSSRIEVIVIARPLEKKNPAYPVFLETFRALIKLGAEIVLKEKIHSKLYIRDQGSEGGLTQAIFGSENLTGSRNIELGIRITNDTVIINKLISYFFELYTDCKPFMEELNVK